MDIHILEDVGLTKVQAHAYKTLVDHGRLSAPALAKLIGESRTNGYKVLSKLCDYGLVLKEQHQGKFKYAAASPAALEQFIRQQADLVRRKEQRLSSELPHMLDYFFAHSERPSIRYFEGRDGIVNIYKDQLVTGQPLYYVRTRADIPFLGFEELHHWRNKFPRFGIERYTIIPDAKPTVDLAEGERMPVEESDALMRLHRTWIHEADYTAPVEWTAYGNKLSIIAYGEEAMGMVIESPPIATAFRQLFSLLDEGIRRRPGYSQHPYNETYTAIPEAAKKSTRPQKSNKGEL